MRKLIKKKRMWRKTIWVWAGYRDAARRASILPRHLDIYLFDILKFKSSTLNIGKWIQNIRKSLNNSELLRDFIEFLKKIGNSSKIIFDPFPCWGVSMLPKMLTPAGLERFKVLKDLRIRKVEGVARSIAPLLTTRILLKS